MSLFVRFSAQPPCPPPMVLWAYCYQRHSAHFMVISSQWVTSANAKRLGWRRFDLYLIDCELFLCSCFIDCV